MFAAVNRSNNASISVPGRETVTIPEAFGPAVGPSDCKSQSLQTAGEPGGDRQDTFSDPGDPDRQEAVDGRFHPEDPHHVHCARLIPLRGWMKFDFFLGDKSRGLDIPRAKKSWPAKIEALFADIDDPDGQRSQHPFVRVGAEKIHIFDRRRKSAEGLNGVHREQNFFLPE